MEEMMQKDGAFKRALKVIFDCLKEAVVPFVMYGVTGLLLFLAQGLPSPLHYAVGVLCLLLGIAFNVYLSYRTGKEQYDAYLTGNLHRQNERLGIMSGGNHRIEREYRFWKGFLTGFFVALPVVIMGVLGGAGIGMAIVVQSFLAGWSVVPISWIGVESGYWCVLPAILPFVVSGVAYLIGANVRRVNKEAERERSDKVKALDAEQKRNRNKR